MRKNISRTTAFLYFLFPVIIDRRRLLDNFSLIICQISQRYRERLQLFSHNITGNLLRLFLHSLINLREKER